LGWTFFLLVCLANPVFSFQYNNQTPSSELNLLEAGLVTKDSGGPAIYYLSAGEYTKALTSLTPEVEGKFPWLKDYLTDLVKVSSSLQKRESTHFELFLPADQLFLADYALSSIEKSADTVERVFGTRPKGKIRIEIYPNKDTFSQASTLTMETLERSGAIGICKFHRLMITSPKSLPLGYRWLDALSHEYMHLIINELSHTGAQLWLHEGTARYFETLYRMSPPEYLSPNQRTQLLEALEKKTLVPFERMAPSMVYLKDQDEVSLAFAEVAYSINVLMHKHTVKKFGAFLKSLRTDPFEPAFQKAFGWDLPAFEKVWMSALAEEKWQKTKGAMSDNVQFQAFNEEASVGADVQGRLRIADRMRRQGHSEAALIEYEKALKEEPDNAVLLMRAAKVHVELNQKQQAIEKLRKATLQNPNYGTPHIELAELLGGKDALFHLLEANAINPFDPRIHRNLRDVYTELGRIDDAKREGDIFLLLSR